jgi:leucine dehydrogenase
MAAGMDGTDAAILAALQRDGRQTNRELARAVGLAPSTCLERVRGLLPPEVALAAPTDVLVPAAVGGVLAEDTVPGLRCGVVVGPANNQLTDDTVAERLHARGIVWVPDYVVGAGGVIHATAMSLRGRTHAQALAEVDRIGATVSTLLATARRDGRTPHAAALRLAGDRGPGLAEVG